MKNKLLILCFLYVTFINAQPIGTPPNAFTVPPPQLAQQAWYKGGNTNTGVQSNANIFGTIWNSPIYTVTAGTVRTRLNGNFTNLTNNVNQNLDGYFGISPNGYFTNNSPATMLHLYGPNNTNFGIGGGWRSWMSTGMFVNENSDAMYIGMKPEAGTNRSDAVIAWNDDASASQPSTDKLRFIFTGSNTNGNGTGTNPINPGSLEGYEYMRMTSASNQNNSIGAPVGYIGIGPVFNNAAPPQNRVHINAEEALPVFVQISNQNAAQGTGQTANDGLHVGYAPTNLNNKQAQIIQKENDRLTFYTNNGERLKIMHIGALNNGTNLNPGTLATNLTRIAISHNPTTPITRPLSLMHLGYDVQGATNDGWRAWMDVGIYMSNQSDNVYLGLKQEPAILGDRQDAVLSWGDNQVNSNLPPGNGPDNFRFIFTSTTAGTGGGTAPATTANGLEALRMTPTSNTGVFTGIGGAPVVNQYVGATDNPTNTLEVNSWGTTVNPGGSSGLRFTNLNTTSPTIANPGLGVLAVDSLGDVIYVPASANTGIGNYCSAPAQNSLTGNYEVPLANNNYYFSGAGLPNTNSVSVGYPCANLLPAKFNSYQNAGITVGVNTIAGDFINEDVANSQGLTFTGLIGEAKGVQTLQKVINIGGDFKANGAFSNTGIRSTVNYPGNDVRNTAGLFITNSNSKENRALDAFAGSSDISNTGILAVAYSTNTTATNHAGSFVSNGGNNNTAISATANFGNYNVAIYARVDPSSPNSIAGYFEGDVFVNNAINSGTGFLLASDQNLKTNINSISNASTILNQIQTNSFYYDTLNTHNLKLSSKKQYGVIAQQVESILPELVSQTTKPADWDTTGIMINAPYTYKTVNYNGFIALLIKAYQEQQSQIQSKDSAINSLNDRLTSLENCINGLNLCGNTQAVQQSNANNQNLSITNIELTDAQSIILEQNVPNPFAEQTTINYFLPDDVNKAQLLFYNAQGKLIQSLELTQKGKGSINVFASDLSNGIYTYTLVVDGKIIETKKMVKN